MRQNTVQPDLATSWTYASPTQLTFTLRSDVKFQDGTPFNADAVVTNINRILNDHTSPRYSEISSVTSVQAVDSTHVQFNLSKPFAPLLAALTDRAGMMLSPAAIASGEDLVNAPKNAGSGPFEFVEWVKGDHLTLQRNPNYWDKSASGASLPYLDKVVYHPITNESVMYTNLQTGTMQVAGSLGATDVAAAKANPSLTYKQSPGLSFFGIELNTQAAPFNNVHARRAVAWGVNRQEIVTSVLHNVGVVAQGPISPSSWAYSASIAPYSYDTTKAKAELQQAGMTSLTFTLIIPSGSPATAQLAQYLQSELQGAGITMNIKQETFASLLSDSAAHTYQAALLGWSGRPDPDGNMYSWFHTGGGFNDMQYSNPQVDAQLEAARASSDQTAARDRLPAGGDADAAGCAIRLPVSRCLDSGHNEERPGLHDPAHRHHGVRERLARLMKPVSAPRHAAPARLARRDALASPVIPSRMTPHSRMLRVMLASIASSDVRHFSVGSAAAPGRLRRRNECDGDVSDTPPALDDSGRVAGELRDVHDHPSHPR